VGPVTNDDDIGSIQTDTPRIENEILSIQTSKGLKWLGFRKPGKELFQDHMLFWHQSLALCPKSLALSA
jgi:hypothetical protein